MTASHDIPQRIGRFRIDSVLGRGAMGIVYKGYDEQIDRPVGIKLIRADLLEGEERENYFARFLNEAKIAGRCLHQNIVNLYDFSFHENNPYLVMEYVDGVGLQQALPRGTQWKESDVIPIALQALNALNYAHSLGIVHRDVKPPNILLTTESKLKITDFGISRLSSTEQTMTPLLIGTPSYMSPEQCMGGELDGRSDLFSLGCVMYEMLAGRKPFTGASYTDTIISILNKPHEPLQNIRSDLTPALVEAIDRALAKKPADRFENARAFAYVLEEISGSSASRITPIPADLAEKVAQSQKQSEEKQFSAHKSAPSADDDDDTLVAPLPERVEEVSHQVHPGGGVKQAALSDEDDDPTEVMVLDDLHAKLAQESAPHVGEQVSPEEAVSVAEGTGSESIAGGYDTSPSHEAHEDEQIAWLNWTAQCLTRVIGPIGPLVVERFWKESHPEALIEDCANFIQHANEREAFLRYVHGTNTFQNLTRVK
ncbi:serine/threonine-protein kinase [Swingsia samuiensis]|uniref:Serine/threonine protein kinase n=1 Tax=Swingsia samuiensis TaxID=1293412 RepID=A0A4Y6UFI3_9PROT|nr:serine/threonine-protein kinase [Swingsia samuiensis]QDH16313.1 serine/threonine protein kinase [Swingsia samuiensis]